MHIIKYSTTYSKKTRLPLIFRDYMRISPSILVAYEYRENASNTGQAVVIHKSSAICRWRWSTRSVKNYTSSASYKLEWLVDALPTLTFALKYLSTGASVTNSRIRDMFFRIFALRSLPSGHHDGERVSSCVLDMENFVLCQFGCWLKMHVEKNWRVKAFEVQKQQYQENHYW